MAEKNSKYDDQQQTSSVVVVVVVLPLIADAAGVKDQEKDRRPY